MFALNRKSLLHNFRSLFYAFSVTVGIYISLQELHQNKNVTGFIIFSIALFTIYVAEIISQSFKKNTVAEINLDIHDKTNELAHFFHKIILPILLYISLVGFGYYNFKDSSLLIILFATFIIFFLLFVNIRAYYEHKLSLEHKTHYIYDMIIFLIFFATLNFISNSAKNQADFLIIFSITAGALTFVLILLMLLRNKGLQITFLAYNLIASIIIGLIFFLLHFGRVVNALQVSLGLLFVFYLTAALIHHKLLKTLTREVFFEYLIVILLVLTITYGIA